METINKIIGDAKLEVKKLIDKAQHGELEAQPGRTMVETFEGKVNSTLNQARDAAGKSAQGSLAEHNQRRSPKPFDSETWWWCTHPWPTSHIPHV